MSRIAGVLARTPGPQADAMLSDLLTSLARPGWRAARAADGIAALAHTGWAAVDALSQGGVLAVVDGRFFNRPELVQDDGELGEAGLLLQLYRRHGFAGALSRINGDFALALYDRDSGSLWLGRDRVGHKPLYYAEDGGVVAFASQPKPLLTLPGMSRAVNRRFAAVFAGSHYRYIDNRPDESPYAAVRQVPAAGVLEVRNGKAVGSRYWVLEPAPDFTEPEPALAERYRSLLLDAVAIRSAQLPAAAFTLSGGMDSSSVLCCAAHASSRRQHAFSSVYADKTYDESEDIRGFVEQNVEQWHPVTVENFDLMHVVGEMVRAHQEPVATATWLSHYLLCDAVRKSGFRSLFGGLGGDELNAGEYEHFVFHFADLARTADRRMLEHEIACWARHHDHPIYRKTLAAAQQAIVRSTDRSKPGVVLVDRNRLTRYYGAVSRDYYDLSLFEPILDHPFESWLKNRAFQDIFRETAPCCLRAEDRNCTAFELEHSDPFFDHRIIEFMFRVPGSSKIRDGITKRLLREAMRGILPEATRTRIKKTGWNAPAHLWFSEAALGQLLDLVHSRAFRERGVYDVREVLRIVEEHRAIVASGAARENHMMFLWQLVNLEVWMHQLDTAP